MTVVTLVLVKLPVTRLVGNKPMPFADAVVMPDTWVLVRMACSLAKALPESSICELALLLRSKEFTPVKPATIKIAITVSAIDSSTMV